MANSIEELNEKLVEIKTELVKIQVSQKYENKDKQIEILQNDIKSLEDKFHASEIAKNNIENKFDKYDSIIDRQDNRIQSLNTAITIFGILITIIMVGFGFRYGQNVKNIAKDEITDWLDTKAEQEFKPKIQEYLDELKKEGEKVLANIQVEADKLNKEHKEKIDNIDITKPLSSEDRTKLEEEAIEIDKKDKKDFSFNNWHIKFLYNYYKKEYSEALKDLEKALQTANDDEDKTMELNNKGVALGELGESQKAIDVYDILIKEFKDSKFESILELVAKAYYNKGVALGELGESQKAIDVFDVFIKEFKNSKSESILEQVAKAYINKGVALGELGESQKAIDVYDILIKEFKDSKSEPILEQVVSAMTNKIERLLIDGKNIDTAIQDIEALSYHSKKTMFKIAMFKILEKAQRISQDEEIEIFLKKYADVELINFSFDELDEWSETITNKDTKERIKKYIEIFKNKL
jgi:tetratricopeptide (TPR) repeat protein